ncbi:MAG: nucleotidyl transferase AbiEii/AbiGii toxin family protein [Candidatus Omnitrophica bacterium]|nr:nucleotidyl transferase AbiEii/AbiGii toxin family protein [Candidatus Omnitrophota bacterium]
MRNRINITQLANDIEEYLNNKTDIEVKTAIQKFRIYLKFPILEELKLTEQGGSSLLFLKIEVFKEFSFCHGYKIQYVPVMKHNKSIIIKTFDLSTLMATKIMAILHRKWEKTDKKGKTIVKVKGRDYFDLMWYLKKGVSPNIKCIKGIEDREKLKKHLLTIVNNIDLQSIQLDLEQFIGNEIFVKKLSKSIKDIIMSEIQMKL